MQKNGCSTIMRFHNHPNSSPNTQTCFLASEQDKISAKEMSVIATSKGINWIDFVCERGNYLMFFKQFSDQFYPEYAKTSNISKENSVSSNANYRLHRELGLFFR